MDRKYIGSSLWVFGDDGVNIFTPDGGDKVKNIAKGDICHLTAGYRGKTRFPRIWRSMLWPDDMDQWEKHPSEDV